MALLSRKVIFACILVQATVMIGMNSAPAAWLQRREDTTWDDNEGTSTFEDATITFEEDVTSTKKWSESRSNTSSSVSMNATASKSTKPSAVSSTKLTRPLVKSTKSTKLTRPLMKSTKATKLTRPLMKSTKSVSANTRRSPTTPKNEESYFWFLVGGVAGGAGLLLIIVIVVIVLVLRRRKKSKSKDSDQKITPPASSGRQQPSPTPSEKEIAGTVAKESLGTGPVAPAIEAKAIEKKAREPEIVQDASPVLKSQTPEKDVMKRECVTKKTAMGSTTQPKSQGKSTPTAPASKSKSKSKSKSSEDTLMGYPESPDEKLTSSRKGHPTEVAAGKGSAKGASIPAAPSQATVPPSISVSNADAALPGHKASK